MSGIKFGELPPLDRGGHSGPWRWLNEASELRQRPGQWALLVTKANPASASCCARQVRRAILSAFAPAGSFEAVTRGCDVWVRYVGSEAVR